jgi:hypothetical protein
MIILMIHNMLLPRWNEYGEVIWGLRGMSGA